jgi:hypothetical protein
VLSCSYAPQKGNNNKLGNHYKCGAHRSKIVYTHSSLPAVGRRGHNRDRMLILLSAALGDAPLIFPFYYPPAAFDVAPSGA